MPYKTNINWNVDEPVGLEDAGRMGDCLQRLMQIYSDTGIDELDITAVSVEEEIEYNISGKKNGSEVVEKTYTEDDLKVPYAVMDKGVDDSYATLSGKMEANEALGILKYLPELASEYPLVDNADTRTCSIIKDWMGVTLSNTDVSPNGDITRKYRLGISGLVPVEDIQANF
jgi:hypothetical protein